MKIYFASPLFSQSELIYNQLVVNRIERHEGITVYLPQRDGFIVDDEIENGSDGALAGEIAFREDIAQIRSCDIVLAILDGRAIDEGVAVEIGFAYAIGKKCISIQTDTRRLGRCGNNPMITGCLSREFGSIEEMESWICENSRELIVGSGD